MYQPIKIRKTIIAPGQPRICVPITGRDKQELLRQADHAMESNPDIIEWRADCYRELSVYEKLDETSSELRGICKDCPVIFTCRTEDGSFQIEHQEYTKVNKHIIDTGNIDIVDVELMQGEQICRELVDYAHVQDVKVIISNHEFTKTPDVDEMVQRLQSMYDLGADILKLAVMPKNPRDVLKLLQATDTYGEYFGERPVITMSMGKLGSISRLSGEIFGSAVTFATAGVASAPGQMTVEEVRRILEVLHHE